MNCRFCKTPLEHVFVDLGHQPPSNAYLTKEQLQLPEVYYPLRVRVCNNCWLVQTEDYADRTAFFSHDYAYFSSTSSSWLQHASNYSTMITQKLELNKNSFVVEIASNDGYLLKNFLAAGIPCLGIEPTDSTADAAEAIGINVQRDFFGETLATKLATEGKQADLIIGNNVYAHVPDILDFTNGMSVLLKPQGVITLEFPHIMRLVEYNQFDTIYHEHYSYLSLTAVISIFESVGLRIFDVEELTTHGGSLRVYGCLKNADYKELNSIKVLVEEETKRGMSSIPFYSGFQKKVEQIKIDLLEFLITAKKEKKSVLAYGAAATGNTLLNFAGVKSDMIEFVADANLYKQGKFMPGSHIPIFEPEIISKQSFDYCLILPWNIKEEVIKQLTYVRNCDYKFVICIPQFQIIQF